MVAESIYAARAGARDEIGTYTHRAGAPGARSALVGARLGLASIRQEAGGELDRELLGKLADLLALQVVADGSFDSVPEFLASALVKHEHFNRTLAGIAESLQREWKPIGAEATVAEALESVARSDIARITVNAIAYIHSGGKSILKAAGGV